MKYDNLFDSAEAIVTKRLKELPGEENLTMKEAGYNSVWQVFLGEFFESGWDSSVKQASLIKIDNDSDPFIQGQIEAVETIKSAGQDPYVRGWYSFIKQANDSSLEEMHKVAGLLEEETSVEEAGFLAASQNMLESNHDLVKTAWNGPNLILNMETHQMNSFEFGKEAAQDELIDFVNENDASMSDVLALVNDSVTVELDKTASQEDVDFRLGVESFCYDFLKQAAATYGEFDTSETSDLEVMQHVMDKIAADDGPSMNERLLAAGKKGSDFVGDHKKKIIGGGALATGAALTGAGLGARHLYKKRQAAKAAQGQNKKASYQDQEIENAISVLEAAGLLDD